MRSTPKSKAFIFLYLCGVGAAVFLTWAAVAQTPTLTTTRIAATPSGTPSATPAELMQQSPVCPYWLQITLILTVWGGFGGLAWHLVNHKGIVIMPSVWAGDLPESDGIRLGNTRGWRLGFLADLVIGFIAANSIHLAIAGIVDYQAALSDPQKQSRIIFSLIALGILSGFGGATLLKSLSAKLQKMLTPEEEREFQKKVAESSPVREQIDEKTLRVAELVEDMAKAGIILASPALDTETKAGAVEAIRKLAMRAEVYPHFRTLAILLGRLHRKLGHYQQGINALTKTLSYRQEKNIPDKKDDADLLYNVACYYTLLAPKQPEKTDELLQKSWENLRESVRLSPQNLEEALKDDDFIELRKKYDLENLPQAV